MRRVLSAANVALTALGVLTVVMLVLAIQKQDALSSPAAAQAAPVPTGAPTAPATAAPPSVAFIGDGWTSGTPAGGEGPANVTELLASRNGWRVTNTAAYGAGYTSVQPSVAFVADGYTSGSPDGGEGPAKYTALLAAREGWRVTNPAVNGSGYVAGAPLADQVQKVIAAKPQLAIVSGGPCRLRQ